MRRILLLLSLCVAVAAFANNENPLKNLMNARESSVENTIRRVNKPVSYCTQDKSIATRRLIATKALPDNVETKDRLNSGWLNANRVNEIPQYCMIAKEQLDSVIMTNANQEKVSRQYFLFDENYWPVKRINSYWNPDTRKWDAVEEYNYKWDSHGYLLEQSQVNVQYNEGYKEEFIYDEKNRGISKTVSVMSGGEWTYIERRTYKYNDANDPIEEVLSFYEGDWKFVSKGVAEYNAKHRQTLFEEYTWDETDWTGIGKEIYEYDADDNIILYGFHIWIPLTKTWLYFHRYDQKYENGKIVLQEQSYWNKTAQDWSGSEVYYGEKMYNDKTIFNYDAKGRETSQLNSLLVEGVWQKRVELETVWTVLDNGEDQSVRKTYFYESDDVKTQRMELITRYNASGKETYMLEKRLSDGVWQSEFETVVEYDADGYETKLINWVFENNVKLADIQEETSYDAAHNVIESIYQMGLGTGEDDWVNLTKFTYGYANGDVRISKFGYRWTAGQWCASEGESLEYDFDVPVQDLIVFIGYQDDYKLLKMNSYQGAGADTWSESLFTFYYSLQVYSSIDDVDSNSELLVYPNPVVETLYIKVDADTNTSLFDVQGNCLLQTTDKHIDMATYQPGFYIVDVNGIKTTVIKR